MKLIESVRCKVPLEVDKIVDEEVERIHWEVDGSLVGVDRDVDRDDIGEENMEVDRQFDR